MNKHNEKLAWQDDFDGELDLNVWKYLTGNPGVAPGHELQCYTDSKENVYTENSCLCIKATKTDDPEKPYNSGRICTYGKKSFLYGRLEMRAKLPFGNGIWPAFWTVGADHNVNRWPECGEIDIMEMIGGRGTNRDDNGDYEIHCSTHYTNDKGGIYCGPFSLIGKKKYSDDFHIYGIEWTKDELIWYVDNVVLKRMDISENPYFQKPHEILLNLAVGGSWPGSPDETTVFPQIYYIDWVRHYTFED